MKSVLNKCCNNPIKTLPRLMKGKKTGVIVLVSRIEGRCAWGTVIHQGSYVDTVGTFISTLDTSFLEDYDGSVTLEN